LANSFEISWFLVVPEGLKLVLWVHAEAFAVIVAVTAHFMFNRWGLEILPYYRIRHILVPWCVRYHAQSLRLEAFEYFYVDFERILNLMGSMKEYSPSILKKCLFITDFTESHDWIYPGLITSILIFVVSCHVSVSPMPLPLRFCNHDVFVSLTLSFVVSCQVKSTTWLPNDVSVRSVCRQKIHI
jgi:hypothetical protein